MISCRTKSPCAGRRAYLLAVALILPPAPAPAQEQPTAAPRPITRPDGRSDPNLVSGQFVVLGAANRTFTTGNLASGTTEQTFEDRLLAPFCTSIVVPVLTGWDLGYGTLEDDAATTRDIGWGREGRDRHFGRGRIDLAINGIASLQFYRLVRVQIRASLGDVDGRDPWWGVVRYQLIFLGTRPSRAFPPACT